MGPHWGTESRLTRNLTVTSWSIDQCSATEPHRPGEMKLLIGQTGSKHPVNIYIKSHTLYLCTGTWNPAQKIRRGSEMKLELYYLPGVKGTCLGRGRPLTLFPESLIWRLPASWRGQGLWSQADTG